MINEKKLNEVLKQMNENMVELKNSVEFHEHSCDGSTIRSTTHIVRGKRGGGYLYIDDEDDLDEIFKKKGVKKK